jgi:hypothetical protein
VDEAAVSSEFEDMRSVIAAFDVTSVTSLTAAAISLLRLVAQKIATSATTVRLDGTM